MYLYLHLFLRIILGFLFIFSAYTKLFPLEYFEYFLYKFGFSFFWVQWISRLIIWLEFSLGFGFLFVHNIKKIILPVSLFLLLIFSLQLLYTLIFIGNIDDCGCFGSYMQFTPAQALIKNIATMAAMLYLFKEKIFGIKFIFITKILNSVYTIFIHKITQLIISALIIILPISYILRISPPAAFFIYDVIETEFKNKNLDVAKLYTSTKFAKPKVDFAKGKYIIAFLSLTCPHCRIAALKLHALKYKNPALPIHMVLNGENEDLASFFIETKSANVPFTRLNGSGFIEITEFVVPTILFITDAKIDKKVNFKQINDDLINEWLMQK